MRAWVCFVFFGVNVSAHVLVEGDGRMPCNASSCPSGWVIGADCGTAFVTVVRADLDHSHVAKVASQRQRLFAALISNLMVQAQREYFRGCGC